ncbi:GspE/PulE family protein [Chloroflexota bacterium]
MSTKIPIKAKESIRDALIEAGLVTPEQLEEVAKDAKDTELGQLLVDQGIVTGRGLAKVVAKKLNLPYVNLNTYQIQREAVQLIPESMSRKYSIIPLAIVNDTLQIAMAGMDNVMKLEALAARARMRIEPSITAIDDIQRAIDRNYKSYSEIEKQFKGVSIAAPTIEEKAVEEAVAEAPVVRALDLLLKEAVKNRASDIHIEPQIEHLRIRYRIDGVLHDIMTLPLSALGPIISRLKILGNMNIADHRPQDGQFSIELGDREVDVRVATIYTTYGEMGVLRILDKAFAALSLAELGFLPDSLERYGYMLKSPYGMILLSGPTGSGKTTTLYASVTNIDCKGRNVITVEDPVEYRFKDINQIQINPRAGLTFATGLRTIMRLDPDVILVGEIRDSETAEIAVQASLTGHLVLSSVHANDTVGSLFRILDLGVGPFLVSSAIVGIVAQRMVRQVCPHCRRLFRAPTESALAYYEEIGEKTTEFYYGRGCNSCANTGYLGRTAVFEILTMSEEVRGALLSGAGAEAIRAQAKKEGMVTMWRDGMLKVKAGITTPDEVLRNVFSIG